MKAVKMPRVIFIVLFLVVTQILWSSVLSLIYGDGLFVSTFPSPMATILLFVVDIAGVSYIWKISRR